MQIALAVTAVRVIAALFHAVHLGNIVGDEAQAAPARADTKLPSFGYSLPENQQIGMDYVFAGCQRRGNSLVANDACPPGAGPDGLIHHSMKMIRG